MNGSSDALRRVLTRGSLYTVATAVQLSAGILVLPALTRVLSQTEYGVVAAAVVVQAIVGLLAGAGIPSALSRTYFVGARGPEDARALIGVTVVVAFGVCVLVELTGPWWSALFGSIDYGSELRLAVWAGLPAAALLGAQNVLRAREQPGRFIVTVLIGTAGGQAAGVALTPVLGADGYLAGLLGGYAAAAVAAVAFTGISWPRAAGRRALLRESFGVGLPTVPHSLGIYLLAAGDRVVVERLEGLAAVARYHVAYVAGSLGLYLLSALNNAWSPVIFGARDEERWEILADTSAAVWRIGALAAGALALGAPAGLLVLAPASYDRADLATVTAIVAASAVPMVLYLSNVHIIFWLARTGVLAWVTPLSAAANIGLNLLLIPVLGLPGAALATLATYVLQAALIRWRASGLAGVPWRIRPALQSAALGGALVGAALLLPAAGVWVALRAVAAVAVAAALAAFVARGAFTRRSGAAGAQP